MYMKDLNKDILTKQLILRSFSPNAISSLSMGNLKHAEITEGIQLNPHLLEHTTAFAHDLSRIKTDAAFQNWSTRAVLLRSTGEMIGIFRFHTLPDPEYLRNHGPSLVEIGYAIFPTYRRKGFAEEMIKEMITWAKHYGVLGIVTSIAPNNIPSANLVTKMGFVKIHEEVDEVDGIEHIYLLNT